MNWSKTKVMTNSAKRREEVDGQEIQHVDEYIYLLGPSSLLRNQARPKSLLLLNC